LFCFLLRVERLVLGAVWLHRRIKIGRERVKIGLRLRLDERRSKRFYSRDVLHGRLGHHLLWDASKGCGHGLDIVELLWLYLVEGLLELHQLLWQEGSHRACHDNWILGSALKYI